MLAGGPEGVVAFEKEKRTSKALVNEMVFVKNKDTWRKFVQAFNVILIISLIHCSIWQHQFILIKFVQFNFQQAMNPSLAIWSLKKLHPPSIFNT